MKINIFVTSLKSFTCSSGTNGLGAKGSQKCIERRTNTLLVLVISRDLLTTKKYKVTPALSLKV